MVNNDEDNPDVQTGTDREEPIENEASEISGPGPNEMFCKSCGEIIKEEAEICPHCGVRQRPAPLGQSSKGDKNPGLAAIASAIVPGLGQIYNSQIMKGIIIMILSGISVLLMFIIIGFFTYFILWVWAIYDAYKTAEKINAGEIAPE